MLQTTLNKGSSIVEMEATCVEKSWSRVQFIAAQELRLTEVVYHAG